MPTVRLTEARINTLKPGKSARDVRDSDLKGFGIRIMPSRRKRFFLNTQHEGRRIWKLIGEPGQMALAEAREAARTVLAAIWKGQPAARSPEVTVFETVAEEVFFRYARHWKPSALEASRGYLRKQILPWFGGRQIADITRTDVQDWFMSLHATPVAADRSAPVLSVIMVQAEVCGYRPEVSDGASTRMLRESEVKDEDAVEKQRPKNVLGILVLAQPFQGSRRNRQLVPLSGKEAQEQRRVPVHGLPPKCRPEENRSRVSE